MASYSNTGVLNWSRSLSGTGYSTVFDLERAPNGDIYILGEFENELVLPGMSPLTASTTLDMFVARVDPATGLCRSAYHYGKVGGANGQSYGSVWPTANGLYVADCYDSTFTMGTHVLEPSGPVATDIFIAKFDSLSGFTGIQSMPLQEGSLHIYANPNKGTCTIDLPPQLRLTNDLLLSIVDQTGRVVQRIPIRYTAEGVAIDIRAQAKGIYHVELGDGEQRYTGRIVFE
ncbi:MAG: T9SS type A sorting domain-containing protein, partial [Flavobacteriales bacterium]